MGIDWLKLINLSSKKVKGLVEESIELDISPLKDLVRQTWETGKTSALLAGNAKGTINLGLLIEKIDDWLRLRLDYAHQSGARGLLGAALGSQSADVRAYVRIATTCPNYGGVRFWFVCGKCERRQAKLYKPKRQKYFFCRKCHGLNYKSTRDESRESVVKRKLMTLQRRLKGEGRLYNVPKRPKGMHRKTYDRLIAEYFDLLTVYDLIKDERYYKSLGRAARHLSPDIAKVLMGATLGADSWEHLRAYKQAGQYETGEQALPDREIKEQVRQEMAEERERERERLEREIAQRLEWERELEEERIESRYGTLGEIAKLANVPHDFALEAQAYGLIRPDRGRGRRKKRYRWKLAAWLSKLHILNQAGYSWDDLKAWTKRRFKEGHEHEAKYPAGFREIEQ